MIHRILVTLAVTLPVLIIGEARVLIVRMT